jgi:hypothetical protein
MTLDRNEKYFLGALMAAFFCFHSALALAADEVLLKDGTVLRGTVVKQMPGKVVVIKTTSGTTESIPWDDVKRVSLGEEPAAPRATDNSNNNKPPSSGDSGSGGATSSTATSSAGASDQAPADAGPPKPPFPSYWDVGARAGYAIPSGKAVPDAEMTDVFSGKVPFWLEANWHPTANVSLGLVGELGPVLTKNTGSACGGRSGTQVECSALNYRIGVQVLIYPSPNAIWSPFFGVGVGYEWLHVSQHVSSGSLTADASTTLKGLELLHLQAGIMRRFETISIGPFIGTSLGTYLYSSQKITQTKGSASVSRESTDAISSPTFHNWLTFGIRGTYQIGP